MLVDGRRPLTVDGLPMDCRIEGKLRIGGRIPWPFN